MKSWVEVVTSQVTIHCQTDSLVVRQMSNRCLTGSPHQAQQVVGVEDEVPSGGGHVTDYGVLSDQQATTQSDWFE